MDPDLARMAAAVVVLGPHGFTVDGERFSRPPDGSQDGRPALEEHLAGVLYRRHYLRLPPDGVPTRQVMHPDPQFEQDLCAAVSGEGPADAGWTLVKHDRRGCVVRSPEGLQFGAPEAAVETLEGSHDGGTQCRVRLPAWYTRTLPAYLLVRGSRDGRAPHPVPKPVVRLYWNLRADGAARLVAVLTAELEAARVSYRMKALLDPVDYVRPDAAVLYVPASGLPAAIEPVLRAYREVRSYLQPPVPALTLRLAPGLSCADDPGGGRSFGEDRCRLVATATSNGLSDDGSSLVTNEQLVAETFGAHGLDVDAPHASAGSETGFAELLSAFTRSRRGELGSRRPDLRPPEAGPTNLLDAATHLAERICQDARWDREGRRCTWTGRTLVVGPAGVSGTRSGTLGPDLYGGVAGVAVFLAEFYQRTGDESARRTADGAIATALTQLATMGSGRSPGSGLFAGSTGVALAARLVATRTGGPSTPTELLHRVSQVDDTLDTDPDSPHGDGGDGLVDERDESDVLPMRLNDIVSGRAGRILGLLELASAHGAAEDAALRLGHRLADAVILAVETAGTGVGPLTGLAHGTSGMAAALMSLHARRNEARLLDAARAALRYDDLHYAARQRNWADLRQPADPVQPRYMTAWCHGAPGIALCRLVAALVDPEPAAHRLYARTGLDTTRSALARLPVHGTSDLTLCHGVGGLVLSLHTGARIWGDDDLAQDALLVGHRIARTVLAQNSDRAFPTASTGPNPSFMTGTAGLGHLLLALEDDTLELPQLVLPGTPLGRSVALDT